MAVESFEQVGEVAGGELPLEWSGGLVVSGFEVGQALLDHCEISEVVGREHFTRYDGEVDLHLVQPRGVYRSVHHDRIRELLSEPVDGFLPAVGGAVVDRQNTRLAEA